MNIEYRHRNSDEQIKCYLVNILNSMDNLDYDINESFEKNDLFEILMEDLPPTSTKEKKIRLIQDICDISEEFYKSTKSKNIRIQFKVIQNDMCRLFHVDNNIQRLLCTYHGSGTQWLDEDNTMRKGLGQGDNDKIVKDHSKIQMANEFDILLLRGKRFSLNSAGGVHRSPPIKTPDEKRILLKIDEV